MPWASSPCPQCGAPIPSNAIRQARQQQLACPKCGRAIRVSAQAKRNPVAAGPPPSTPPDTSSLPEGPTTYRATAAVPGRRTGLLAAVVLAGIGLVLVSGLVTALIVFRQDDPGPGPKTVPEGGRVEAPRKVLPEEGVR